MLDLFDKEENIFHNKIQDGEYLLIRNFYSISESSVLLNKLLQDIRWEQEQISMYGKIMDVPRLSSWYGEKDSTYTYSGITHHAHAWNETLLEIKHKLEESQKLRFNSVLLNLYRDGSDSVSWHADDEKELGLNPIITSLSFGASRKFQLRHNTTKERIDLELHTGDLLIMKGQMQHYWQHQIPKTKRKIAARVNLTFRQLVIS